MVSERLQDFLLAWCNPDSDVSEAAEMLHRPRNTDYREWLPGELLAAARAGELTPEAMEDLTGGGGFRTQADVQRWLDKVWPLWFGRPYPG